MRPGSPVCGALLACCGVLWPLASTATPPNGAAPASTEVGLAAGVDDDEPEAAAERTSGGVPQLPPDLARLSPSDIRRLLAEQPAALGPLSVGWTNSGMLLNGVQLPPSDLYAIMDPAVAWATRETVAYLQRAVERVREQFPDSPRLYVGHLSQRRGGQLASHKSHQNGRDVDVDYYLKAPERGFYRLAKPANLDRARTWAFVRALISDTDVQMIFVDTSIQRLLKQYARQIGEDPDWLDSIFEYDSRQPNPIIRHAQGHRTHMHVRFYSPIAQEMGRRAYSALVALGRIEPERYYVQHRACRGDTLGRLARRYGTTVEAIQKANGLHSTVILQNQTYRIPQRGRVRPAPGPVRIPPRRRPPSAAERGAAGSGLAAAP